MKSTKIDKVLKSNTASKTMNRTNINKAVSRISERLRNRSKKKTELGF